jgi:HTH-type transcriptional regulator/antitoxin HigA
MKRKASNTAVPDSYLRLISEGFPLRPIRNEKEYDAAVSVMDKLALRNEGTLDPGEQDYLDAITMFVSVYDDEHHHIDSSKLTPVELLRGLMAERRMTKTDLGRVIGSQSIVSMILGGRRDIDSKQAKVLGTFFALDPVAFIRF